MVRLLNRALFLLFATVGLSFAFLAYYQHNSLQHQLEEAQAKQRQLQQIIGRIQTDRRVAKILVTDQKTDAAGELQTTLLFVEYRRDGSALPAKKFTVVGDEVHIDGQIVKFNDEYVQKGDPLRGQSILLFTRLYGAHQAPADGFAIDAPGSIPEIYKGQSDAVSSFEQDLWKNFWSLYNDRAAREARGIRGLNGEGLYGMFDKDHLYTITVRADGDGTVEEEPIDPVYRAAMQQGTPDAQTPTQIGTETSSQP